MLSSVQINPERSPVVFTRDGEVFANSRDVAAFFGKNHSDVLRAIRNLVDAEPELGRRNFASFKINDLTGESTSHFDMDRDGFTLLAMGFTGTKALKWKLRYIEAFNAMEAECRRIVQSGPAIDLNDPAQLRGLLLNYSEKAEQLERRVREMIPDVAALDRIAAADGSMCITDAAKSLQIRPKALFDYLQANGWIYRRPGGSGWIGYQARLASGVLEHKVTTVLRADGSEKVTEQVRVTALGLTRLAKLIPSAARPAGE